MNIAAKMVLKNLRHVIPQETLKEHISEKAVPMAYVGLTKLFELPENALEPDETEHCLKIMKDHGTIYAQVATLDENAREMRLINTYDLQELLVAKLENADLYKLLDKL